MGRGEASAGRRREALRIALPAPSELIARAELALSEPQESGLRYGLDPAALPERYLALIFEQTRSRRPSDHLLEARFMPDLESVADLALLACRSNFGIRRVYDLRPVSGGDPQALELDASAQQHTPWVSHPERLSGDALYQRAIEVLSRYTLDPWPLNTNRMNSGDRHLCVWLEMDAMSCRGGALVKRNFPGFLASFVEDSFGFVTAFDLASKTAPREIIYSFTVTLRDPLSGAVVTRSESRPFPQPCISVPRPDGFAGPLVFPMPREGPPPAPGA